MNSNNDISLQFRFNSQLFFSLFLFPSFNMFQFFFPHIVTQLNTILGSRHYSLSFHVTMFHRTVVTSIAFVLLLLVYFVISFNLILFRRIKYLIKRLLSFSLVSMLFLPPLSLFYTKHTKHSLHSNTATYFLLFSCLAKSFRKDSSSKYLCFFIFKRNFLSKSWRNKVIKFGQFILEFFIESMLSSIINNIIINYTELNDHIE